MKQKILVIEDDLDTREILGFLLEDMNYEVSGFGELISIADTVAIDPDIIIVDYWLPNGRGAEFCAGIKKHPVLHSIPVIIISTHLELSALAKDSCADGYAEKPFDIDELAQIIARVSSQDPPPIFAE